MNETKLSWQMWSVNIICLILFPALLLGFIFRLTRFVFKTGIGMADSLSKWLIEGHERKLEIKKFDSKEE